MTTGGALGYSSTPMIRVVAMVSLVFALACRAATPAPPVPPVATPPDVVAVMTRAQQLIDDGRPSEAVDDVKLVMERAPKDARSHRLFGLLMEARDDVAGALAAYGRSLALLEDAAVRRRAAQLATSLERHDEAVAHWEAVCAAEPSDLAARLSLAMAYEKADRPASAEVAYGQSVRMAPENPAIRRRFASFLEGQGRPSRARALRIADEPTNAPKSPARMMRALPASGR